MKILILIILILCGNYHLKSQEAVSINYLAKNSVKWPNQGARPYYLNKSQQNVIFELDVYRYYNLQNEYDSELKKSIFERTEEYNDKLATLKRLKDELINTNFYFKLDILIGDYNMQKKGFTIDFSQYVNTNYNTIYSIKLDGLENISSTSNSPEQRAKNEAKNAFGNSSAFEIEILCNESIGLEIENNRNNISAYFFFRINGADNGILKSDKFHLFIANNETQKIYYDINKEHRPQRKEETEQQKELEGQKRIKEMEAMRMQEGRQRQLAEQKLMEQEQHMRHQNSDRRDVQNAFPKDKKSTGSGLSKSGSGFSLTGRSLDGSLPQPSYSIQEEGVFVVQVTVDKYGKVVDAEYQLKGSTSQNSTLIKAAIDAAEKTRFNSDPNASAFQKGTITYHFELN